MAVPTQFIIEGLDRLGKDTLIQGIQHRLGYHMVLHFAKPTHLDCYGTLIGSQGLKAYQEQSFRTMFQILGGVPQARVICNRAHLGECVYAPMYRGYAGEYVFDIEREFAAPTLGHLRLVLLVEDIQHSRHFVDDGDSLGPVARRSDEQALFLSAFHTSAVVDKRIVCVTDVETGRFRDASLILDEVLAPLPPIGEEPAT